MEFYMKSFMKWFGIIVLIAVIGFSMSACDLDNGETNRFDTSTILGDWYLLEGSNNNKTGSIITISGNSGILTVIGNDDHFERNIGSNDYGYNLGGVILRNIEYIGIIDNISNAEFNQYWECETIITSGHPSSWRKGSISYNTNTNILNVYVFGNHSTGVFYRFTKQ
jgi:hypothetical protein